MITEDSVHSIVYPSFVMHVNSVMERSKCSLYIKLIFQQGGFPLFSSRWFVIKDSYITYIRPDTQEVRFPMLVDRGFEVSTGIRNVVTSHGIKIRNLQRTLFVKCRTKRDFDEWTYYLHQLMEQSKSFMNSTPSRFNSYAPMREKQLAYW